MRLFRFSPAGPIPGLLASLLLLGVAAPPAEAQAMPPIAAVDLHGRFTVPDSVVRQALGIRPGDPVPDTAAAAAAIARIVALPGVTAAQLAPVCCDDGGTLLYVGIEGTNAPRPAFRQAPAGTLRLPDEVAAAGEAFDQALRAAAEAGEFGEDDSLGHSLMHFPAARHAQERFIPLADRHEDVLRTVLRESVDPSARARAAQVLAYVGDKRRVVGDLVAAMSDPSERVRNDAMRALALIAGLAERRPELGISVPPEPFIALLQSPVWTDRNKASLALSRLTASRDSAVLAALAEDALPELVQMARWRSMGHAMPALVLLGQIGNLPDDAIFAALQSGDREALIRSAIQE